MAVGIVSVWTGRRASALQSALRLTNENFAGQLGVAVRTVANWHSKPDLEPAVEIQEALDTALGRAEVSAQQRFELILDAAEGRPRTVLDLPAIAAPKEPDLMAAAHESANDAAMRGADVSEGTELARAQMTELARQYSSTGPTMVFETGRQIRNLTYALADRTRRPADLVELYVVAGGAHALLSSIAFDLGQWNAARLFSEAATQYAQLSRHRSLEAWIWGLRATLANWRADFDEAVAAYDRGLAIAPRGMPRHRLRYIAARTRSGMGDTASVHELLWAGQADRADGEAYPDEFAQDIGGEFAFNDARASACAAAAWLSLEDGTQAEAAVAQAMALYDEVDESQRPFSPVNGLRIDLAAARLLSQDFDGAKDAIAPVLELEQSKRNAALVGRMSKVREHLRADSWHGLTDADRLAGEIAAWQQTGLALQLPQR